MHPRSVVARLMGWQVLASTLAVALVTAVIMFEKLKSETGYLDERMHFFASMLAEAAAGEQGNTAGLTQRLGAFQSVIDRAFKTIEYESDYPLLAQVFAGDGRLIYASKLAPPSAMAAPLPATADPGQSAFSDAQWRGQSYRLLQVRSRDRSTTVVLAESQAARRAVMWPLLLSLALRQFLALLLCLAALWWATRSILRPLSQLTSELMRRQPGELKPFEVQAAAQAASLVLGPGLDGVGVGLTVNLPGSAAPALAAVATRVAAVASAAVNPGAASSHNG
jgi:Two-component sensor kinase N-terminal